MTNEEFSKLVQRAIDANLTMKLAIEYEVAISTINRWAKGIIYPLPRMIEVIASYIKAYGVE